MVHEGRWALVDVGVVAVLWIGAAVLGFPVGLVVIAGLGTVNAVLGWVSRRHPGTALRRAGCLTRLAWSIAVVVVLTLYGEWLVLAVCFGIPIAVLAFEAYDRRAA